MKNFLSRAAALLALAVYFPSVLQAADYSERFFSGQKTFESYLARAAEQSDQSRFERIAREGIGAAVFEWERDSLDLKLLGLDEWLLQREIFERRLGERADEALGIWLKDKRMSETQAVQKSALYAELQKAAEDFLFVDEDGSESKIVSNEKIVKAKEQWEVQAQKIVQKHLDEFSNEDDFYFIESKVCNALMNSLLYDHASLKKISDSQAAAFLAETLAAQIEDESSRELSRLFNSLEKEVEQVPDGADCLSRGQSDAWLEQFERELQRGLERWNQAEEDFLAARSEWELQAERVYASDSQKWQDAYEQLQERKLAWSQKIQEQTQSGLLEWQKKISGLDEEISWRLQDIQNSIALETEQKKQSALSQVQAYEQSRAILQTVQMGVDNWYARWSDKYNGLYSYWKSEDREFGKKHSLSSVTTNDLKNEIFSWKCDFISTIQDFFDKAAKEFVFRAVAFSGQFPYTADFMVDITYKKQRLFECGANSSSEELAAALEGVCAWKDLLGPAWASEACWSYIMSAQSLWDAPAELYEWLDMFDKFEGRANGLLESMQGFVFSEDDLCDDYSVQKARTAALLEAWDERAQIAQVVYDYSQNLYSDIDSAQKTAANLEAALEAFNETRDDWQALLDQASEKKDAAERARNDYLLAMQKAQGLEAAFESERAVYDELYDERESFWSSVGYWSLEGLLRELNAYNTPQAEMEKKIEAYFYKESQKEEAEFKERALEMRNGVENGSEGLSFDCASLDGLELGEEIQSAKEALADEAAGLLGTFSMAKIQETIELLDSILRSNVYEKAVLEGLVSDLAVLDKESAEKLRPLLERLDPPAASANDAAGNIASDAEEERAAALLEIPPVLAAARSRAETELKNREAALLLFDGSVDEINEFFEENPAFADVYEQYKDYSCALVSERQKEARALVAEVIQAREDESLLEYMEKLDAAALELSAADAKILALYKQALLDKDSNAGRENALQGKMAELNVPSLFSVEKIDWNEKAFERRFLEEAAPAPLENFDEAAFFELLSGRAKILDELEERLLAMESPSEKYAELCARVQEQKAKMRESQAEYERALAAASSDDPQSAINVFCARCKEYNDFLEECSGRYEAVKKARFDYRLAQEIYFYGQNEYLREDYKPMEKLEQAKAQKKRLEEDLLALQAAEKEFTFEELDAYKDSYSKYCSARALLGIYEGELSAQKERVDKARTQEAAAMDKIVCDAGAGQEGFSVPAAAADFVLVQAAGGGIYQMSLAQARSFDRQENERLLKEYYASAAARSDALEFLQGMANKPYTLLDLALAAMCLKSYGNDWQRALWYAYGEDPAAAGNYKMGDLPDIVHGVNLAESCQNGRMNAIHAALSKVALSGGNDDLAKFILFCDANFSAGLDVHALGKNGLMASALGEPLAQTESAAFGWNASAEVNLALAATFQGIACIPFIGAWAQPFANFFKLAGTALQVIASKLYETAADIKGLCAGCTNNVIAWSENLQGLLLDLAEAKEKTQREAALLARLDAGTNSAEESLSWADLKNAALGAVKANGGGVLEGFFDGACNKEFYEALASGKKILNASQALQEIVAALKEDCLAKKSALDLCAAQKMDSLSLDMGAFYNNLLSFYSKDVLQSLPVNLGGQMEEYQKEVLVDFVSLRNEALDYFAAEKLKEKEALLSVLREDLQGQFCDWQESTELILNCAAREWQKSQENIESACQLWQRDWSLEYMNASDEWEENYKDFLKEKEHWICQKYMGASQGDSSFDAAAKIPQSAVTAALMDDSSIDAYLFALCDCSKFERFDAAVQNLAVSAKNASSLQSLFLSDKIDSSLLKNLDEACALQRDLQAQMESAAAKYCAQRFQKELQDRLDGYMDSIERQNKGYENWELDMVRQSGYTVDPLIHRDAVVASSLFKTEREIQWVHRYNYFVAARPQLNLSFGDYEGSQSHYIMKKVERLQKELESWALDIFGSGGMSDGKFSEHVGRAPVFKKDASAASSLSAATLDRGSGEIGLIMLDYQWNSIKNSGGYAELSKSLYEHKIVDTGIDGLSLPTLRDVAGVVFDIAGSFPALQFLKYVDDAVFSAVDLGMGYKTWEEVLNDSLRQGLVSGFSTAFGAAASLIGESVKASYALLQKGAASQLFGAAQKAVTVFADGAAANYINAIDFARGKIDWESAARSWADGKVLSSTAGAFLGQALGCADAFDADGGRLNSSLFGGIDSMNQTIGALTAEAAKGLATGNFSINLAGFRGVGFLEFGVKNGAFFAGYGRGGADLSYERILEFAQGAKSVSKAAALMNEGQEGRALLTASNMLAWSGGLGNLSLAQDLISKKRLVWFADSQDGGSFGRTLGQDIVLDQALLSQGLEGKAMIAAQAAYQNSAQNMEALQAMQSVASVFAAAESLYDFDLPLDQNKNDLASMAAVYKQYGMPGLYALYAKAQSAAPKQNEEKRVTLASLLERPWFQNSEENRGVLLGFALSKEDYNKIARDNAIGRFIEKEVIQAAKRTTNAAELEKVAKDARAKAEREIIEGEKNEAYGYKPESGSVDLERYGCTLSTAAYIAYSITGKVVSLAQANEIVKKNNLFFYGADSNGVMEKTNLARGDGYASAVNAIAGSECLQKDGANYSVCAQDNKDSPEMVEKRRQGIFERLIASSESQNEIYFVHARVKNGGYLHSVLFDSMTYTDRNDYKSSSVNVMDPWEGGKKRNFWDSLVRTDFYKLTESGKELYENTRKALRESAV